MPSFRERLRRLLDQTAIPHEVLRAARDSIRRLSRAVQTAQDPARAFHAVEDALPGFVVAWQSAPELDPAPWLDALSDDPSDPNAAKRAMAAALDAPLTIPGLRRLKEMQGGDAVLALFAGGPRAVRLSKREVQQRLYSSQGFFDPEKGARALQNPEVDVVVPACLRIRAHDGYLHFVLTDGHHRVLTKYMLDEPVTLMVVLDESVASKVSFRAFAEEHARQLR